MQRIMVDLPEPDGPQITMRSLFVTREVDVAQHVEIAVPLVHADHVDRDVGLERGGLEPGIARGLLCHRAPHRRSPAASRASTNRA